MKQKTIFFDLDDTLYDRFIPYQKAFRQFFGDRYAEKAPQAFDAVIHRGYEVFAAAHTGKISMRQMHVYRHQIGLADAGIAVTEDEALEMQALYAAQQRQITLTDTMRQVLDFCKGHFAAVGVITNGGVRSQQDKLQSLGISQWVSPKLIFISDACGVMKPAPDIFRLAERAAGTECIYVGDSYSQDVAGAAGCGWTTVWLNRRGDRPDGPAPDRTVHTEQELLDALPALAGSNS